MKDVIINAINMYKEFWGTGMYITLFFIAIIYILALEKDKKKQSLFLGNILIFAGVYLFPLSAYIIMKYCIGYGVYWRMYWLLPVTVMIAYALTSIIFKADARWKKALLTILTLGMLVLNGNTMYNEANFTEAPNPYKLNQDVLAVCDAIEADAAEQGITDIRAIVFNTLVTGIRQYDANIRMPYGRDALRGENVSKLSQQIYNTINAPSLDANALAYLASKGKYNYLVHLKDEGFAEIITAAGYTIAADAGNYYVYRLDTGTIAKTDWLITQYGEAEGAQQIFHTMQDKKGHVVVVDGGWVDNAEKVREVIADLGNHVDAWILTHPHEDHIGAFCEIYDNLGDITIDKIYTVEMAPPELCMENASWDSVTMYERFLGMEIAQLEYVHAGDTISVGKLNIDILSAYEDKVDEISADLLNDGSMMFQVHGKHETMLYCADVGKSMSDYLLTQYGDTLEADYIQMGHHGNGGLKEDFYRTVAPQLAFFDAPNLLFEDPEGVYTTPQNQAIMESLGSKIKSFATAPNSIILK